MNSPALDPDLARQLEELRENDQPPTSWSEVRDVVESVLSTMQGDFSSEDVNLYAEIQALSRYIESTKHELSELQPQLIPSEHIPAAHDELDAVVNATEEATHVIMEAAEAIEETAEKLDAAHADVLTDATTKIYEACSFQDITGQRISKVVNALKSIEEKVDEMIATFGDDEAAKERVRQRREAHVDEAPTDKDLLHGPQMPDESVNQDDIDALLASFD